MKSEEKAMRTNSFRSFLMESMMCAMCIMCRRMPGTENGRRLLLL